MSEHLRHKGRAITLFDYEHLVLQEFPDLYKVKCINHTRVYKTDDGVELHELAPGHVVIAVIPDFTRFQQGDRFKPQVTRATLNEIRDFILARNCPFVVNEFMETLFIKNPIYEDISFTFKVKFSETVLAIDFQRRELIQELIRFLSPWAFDDGAEINFGGKVFKSSILKFVEERTYVDFITDFHLLDNGNSVEFIEARTPRSILVPLQDYEGIEVIQEEPFCPASASVDPADQLGTIAIGDFHINNNSQ